MLADSKRAGLYSDMEKNAPDERILSCRKHKIGRFNDQCHRLEVGHSCYPKENVVLRQFFARMVEALGLLHKKWGSEWHVADNTGSRELLRRRTLPSCLPKLVARRMLFLE